MVFVNQKAQGPKILYSCSSCTNMNIFSGKNCIEDSMHYSDRIIQFTSLFIHDTLHLLSNKFHANPSSIHKYVFINTKLFKFADNVIWVQNPQKEVYLFMGHPVLLLGTFPTF